MYKLSTDRLKVCTSRGILRSAENKFFDLTDDATLWHVEFSYLKLWLYFCGEKRMTEDQRVMYDNVGEVRNADAAMRWSVAQVFLLIHSGLFTIFMTRLAEEAITRMAMCLVGATLGILWLLITDRTQELLTYWNGRLRAFEQSEQHAIYVFGGPEY